MGTTKRTTKRGNLRIGNQWNAITIIARSQTHPLKAVCELVENAIDARAGEKFVDPITHHFSLLWSGSRPSRRNERMAYRWYSKNAKQKT